MNFSPALLLDAALVILVIITIAYFANKGFIAGILDLVGNFAALALAWIVSGKLSPAVFENFFKSGLITKTSALIQQEGSFSLEGLLQGLAGLIPQNLLDSVSASAADLLGSNAPNIAEKAVEQIVAPLVIPLISVVVFFATYLICRLLITFLAAVLSNINRIPLVGGVNKMLGVVIGAVSGVIYAVLVLCLLWAIVSITNDSLPVINDGALSGSYLYSAFSTYNPFF